MRERIDRLIDLKERLAAADLDRIFPFYLPNSAASEAEVGALEREANFRLSQDYRQFLRLANGWPCVLVMTALLSTSEILEARQRIAGT